MVKRVWSTTLIRRGRVLEHARELARTGKYLNHLSMLAEVRQLPDSRMVEERWFQEPDFIRQLDLTCAEAREVRRPSGPGDERRPAATWANGITGAKIAPCEGVEEGSPGPREARAKVGSRVGRSLSPMRKSARTPSPCETPLTTQLNQLRASQNCYSKFLVHGHLR